jgi:acyl-CoA hydrolase
MINYRKKGFIMQNFTIVRQEHLNHHGYLFGGSMLSWVDEFAWIAATRDFPDATLVTRAMERVDFRTPAPPGAILRFEIDLAEQRKTSAKYHITVYAGPPGLPEEKEVLSTDVTFVCVDRNGNKCVLPQKY